MQGPQRRGSVIVTRKGSESVPRTGEGLAVLAPIIILPKTFPHLVDSLLGRLFFKITKIFLIFRLGT